MLGGGHSSTKREGGKADWLSNEKKRETSENTRRVQAQILKHSKEPNVMSIGDTGGRSQSQRGSMQRSAITRTASNNMAESNHLRNSSSSGFFSYSHWLTFSVNKVGRRSCRSSAWADFLRPAPTDA